MTRSLSADLRRRTIAAVASGMTRRAAAVRFGVSSSSVIRWVSEWQASGRDHALKQGGDRRSHRIEAWSAFLLAAIETKADISLVELAEKLAVEHGVRFAPSTIWRCLARHAMTVKKNGARLLFLPPYSPDFNPIENIFAKMKAWIRRAAPRTLDALQHAVCAAIDDVSHNQASACFTAAGYEPD